VSGRGAHHEPTAIMLCCRAGSGRDARRGRREGRRAGLPMRFRRAGLWPSGRLRPAMWLQVRELP